MGYPRSPALKEEVLSLVNQGDQLCDEIVVVVIVVVGNGDCGDVGR